MRSNNRMTDRSRDILLIALLAMVAVMLWGWGYITADDARIERENAASTQTECKFTKPMAHYAKVTDSAMEMGKARRMAK